MAPVRPAVVSCCILLLAASVSASPVAAQSQGSQQAQAPAAAPAAADSAKPLPPEKLQSLVAPIALYPDDLLMQVLVASTYPLEIVQLQQWMAKHPDLKDKALADSVAKQPWDPSIQSMAAVPDVVKRLADDIQWTTELGNAFLAQQSGIMDAVQVMRGHAKEKGALESNEQQKVETQVVEEKTVIVIESTSPEVVYVPSYNPSYVYPPPVYPYPPIYYPPYYPGQAFVSFSFGFMMGAAMWGGSCCYAGWGGGNVIINNNNNFNNINVDRGDRNQINNGGRGQGNRGDGGRGGGRGDTWQHNPSHRGGAPYGDRATSDRFGGSDRPSAGTADRAGAGNRAGNTARPSTGDRASAGAGNRATPSTGNRASAGAGNRATPSTGSRAGGSESIGNRSVPSSSSRNSGLSGGSRGYSGSSARAGSSRGASSYGGSRGGGSRGGGGGRRR